MNNVTTVSIDLGGDFNTVGLQMNHRASLHEQEGVCVVWLDGQPWLRFDSDDVAARRFAMAQLCGLRVATQAQIAAAFGVGTATVERASQAFRKHRIAGLQPKKRSRQGCVQEPSLHKAIVAQARSGESIRAIALRFGISRTAVKTSFKRSNWHPLENQQALPAMPTEPIDRVNVESVPVVDDAQELAAEAIEPTTQADSQSVVLPPERTDDTNPSDRLGDRVLARLGLLDDAAPLFEDADNVGEVGALLVFPLLVQQGVLFETMRLFDRIGPAFYGLRTSVVCLLLLMTLNLSRLQQVMRRDPAQLGRLVGLDRITEVKTIRRKLRLLVAQKRSLELMSALAVRQLAKQDEIWAYLDGHVSVYSGGLKMREHHVARLRAARPSVMDYWVNQPDGAPLIVVSGAPREGLVRQVDTIRDQLRELARDKVVTLIFDREGWSPKLFAQLKHDPHIHFLTYRKAQKNKTLPTLAASLFKPFKYCAHGRIVCYDLADTRVRITYGTGKNKRYVELRQITRRTPKGKQVHILTDDFERSTVELAYRMLHRWTQENYFKYGRSHRDIDALITQKMEPAADGERLVRNPERKAIDASLSAVDKDLAKALQDYAQHQLDPSHPVDDSLPEHISALKRELELLRSRRAAIPATVAFNTTKTGRDAVQPHIETRRLMHCFRIAVDRAELALLEFIRPHFKEWEHEGRSLIRVILHSPGNIRVTKRSLHIAISPQASPYKTRALQSLCQQLTTIAMPFPGTDLIMSFSVLPGRSPS
ncbi:MAG: helix-turn-helix domain-containing protein [Deltaproteobacteria bacterium]|nr:helix-turn-helix domain-containing protein [Deltaproteobacteria bacterium]